MFHQKKFEQQWVKLRILSNFQTVWLEEGGPRRCCSGFIKNKPHRFYNLQNHIGTVVVVVALTPLPALHLISQIASDQLQRGWLLGHGRMENFTHYYWIFLCLMFVACFLVGVSHQQELPTYEQLKQQVGGRRRLCFLIPYTLSTWQLFYQSMDYGGEGGVFIKILFFQEGLIHKINLQDLGALVSCDCEQRVGVYTLTHCCEVLLVYSLRTLFISIC